MQFDNHEIEIHKEKSQKEDVKTSQRYSKSRYQSKSLSTEIILVRASAEGASEDTILYVKLLQ